MKKVGIFTTFFEATSGYSLIGVTETQIRMLLDHGYEPVVLVQENFAFSDEGLWRKEMLDIRPVIPQLALERGVADDFEDRVIAIQTTLTENLSDVETCITQDIVLQDFYKEHNVAMRRYAKTRPDLLWLHWIHSCPTPSRQLDYPNSSRYMPPPGYIVYPNASDKARVCQAYGMGGQEWRVRVSRAGHAIDPLTVWQYDKLTTDLARAADLLSGEVVAVYPARLDAGKQPEKIIRLMSGVKSAEFEPRLLIIDWQSTGEHFQAYIDRLLELAAGLGLSDAIHFTSRLDDRCSQGVPRHVVQELMDLSNVYIHPSRIETYSLVVHEAMLRGCLAVLNFDLPVMQELYGESAIYFDFGSDRVDRAYSPDEQSFWDDEARRLIAEMSTNRALLAKTKARREWNPQALWKEFEPLLYLSPVGERGKWTS